MRWFAVLVGVLCMMQGAYALPDVNDFQLYYQFENDLTNYVDSSSMTAGSGNSFGVGKVGSYARVFGGTASDNTTYVPPGTGNFTLAFWLQQDNPNAYQIIVSSMVGGCFDTGGEYDFISFSSPKLEFRGPSGNAVVRAEPFTSDSAFHRIVMVRYSDTNMTMYYDGAPIGVIINSPGTYDGTNLELGYNTPCTQGFTGRLDEVIYSTVPWSEADVVGDYNSGAGTNYGSTLTSVVSLIAPANDANLSYTPNYFAASLTQSGGTNVSWSCDLVMNGTTVNTSAVDANATLNLSVDLASFEGSSGVLWNYTCVNANISSTINSQTYSFNVPACVPNWYCSNYASCVAGPVNESLRVLFADDGETGTPAAKGWVPTPGGAQCTYSTTVARTGLKSLYAQGSGSRDGCLFNIENLTPPYLVEGWMYDDGQTFDANGTGYQMEFNLGNYGVYHNHLHRKSNDNGPAENGICQDQYKWTIPGSTPIGEQPRENCTGVTMKTNDWVKFGFYVYNRTYMTYLVDDIPVRNGTVGNTGDPFTMEILNSYSPLGGVYMDDITITDMTGYDGTSACTAVNDSNVCGDSFTGNLSDYELACTIFVSQEVAQSLGTNTGTSDIPWIGNSGYPSAFTFNASTNYSLENIQFYLAQNSGGGREFTVEIFNSSGGLPDKRISDNRPQFGTGLALGYYNATGYNVSGQKTFLYEGQQYWVVFGTPNNDSGFYRPGDTLGSPNIAKYCSNGDPGFNQDVNKCTVWSDFASSIDTVTVSLFGTTCGLNCVDDEPNWQFFYDFHALTNITVSASDAGGFAFIPNADLKDVCFYKASDDGDITCYLRDTDAVTSIENASFVGDAACFSTQLEKDHKYWIECDAEGASRNKYYGNLVVGANNHTYFNWYSGSYSFAENTVWQVIQGVSFNASVGAMGDLVDAGGFDGATNFSGNTLSLNWPVLEKEGYFKIQWNGAGLNFSGANMTENVLYGVGWVSVNSGVLPAGVNTSANVTLRYAQGDFGIPLMYADGEVCGACVRISYNATQAVFSVPHFTNYSIANDTVNVSLTLVAPINNTNVSYNRDYFAATLVQTGGVNSTWTCDVLLNGVASVNTVNMTHGVASGTTGTTSTYWQGLQIETTQENLQIKRVYNQAGVTAPDFIVLNMSYHAICVDSTETTLGNGECVLPYAGVYFVVTGASGDASYDYSDALLQTFEYYPYGYEFAKINNSLFTGSFGVPVVGTDYTAVIAGAVGNTEGRLRNIKAIELEKYAVSGLNMVNTSVNLRGFNGMTGVEWQYACYNAYYNHTAYSETYVVDVTKSDPSCAPLGRYMEFQEYYKFDNTELDLTGKTVLQYGTSNDASNTTAMMGGYARKYAGVEGDYMPLPQPIELGDFTVAYWVKVNDLNTTTQRIFNIFNTYPGDANVGLLYYGSVGKWVLAGQFVSTEYYVDEDEQYHRHVITRRNGVLYFYRDGRLAKSIAFNYNLSGIDLTVGSGNDGLFFTGNLDEFIVERVGWNASDVLADYNGGAGKNYAYLCNPPTLQVLLNNSVTGVSIQNFCVVSPFSQCTTNGTASWVDLNAATVTRNYTISQVNDGGYYNTTKNNTVTSDADVTLSTRTMLTLSGVVTDKTEYWNKTDADVVTSWIANNGSQTVTSVAYSGGQTGATVSVNDFVVGMHNVTVTVSEVVEGTNYSVTSTSVDFLVSKLNNEDNIVPSGGILSSRYQNISWDAATGGYSVTYDVIYNNGTNTTIATGMSGTSMPYNFTAATSVGGRIYVLAKDGVGIVDTVQGASFDVVLGAHVMSVACPAVTLPNEDNLPQKAALVVNASTYSELQDVSGATANATNVIMAGTTNCTVLSSNGDDKTWQCFIPMEYWYTAGNYTTTFNWNGASNVTVCNYAALMASQRTTSSVYFPNAAPGVVNATSSTPVTIRNTGNVPINLSMTGYDLSGRSVTNVNLPTSAFFAGSTLGVAKQLQNATVKSLNMQVTPSSGAAGNIWLWLSMPQGQIIQEYYTSTPWQAVVTSG